MSSESESLSESLSEVYESESDADEELAEEAAASFSSYFGEFIASSSPLELEDMYSVMRKDIKRLSDMLPVEVYKRDSNDALKIDAHEISAQGSQGANNRLLAPYQKNYSTKGSLFRLCITVVVPILRHQ